MNSAETHFPHLWNWDSTAATMNTEVIDIKTSSTRSVSADTQRAADDPLVPLPWYTAPRESPAPLCGPTGIAAPETALTLRA